MLLINFLSSNVKWLSAGILLTFISCFGQTFFISIFGGQIRSEFGLSHAAWAGIYSLGTTISAITMVWAGTLTDIFRTRVLGVFVFFGLACTAAIMYGLTSAWLLPVVIFALRFFGQGMCLHLAVVAMSRWFVANRGRAISLGNLGFSIGEAILPVLFVFLMGFWAWQKLWLLSAIFLLLAAPVLWQLLKQERTPQSFAKNTTTSVGMRARHWTRMEAIRHPLFWYILPLLLGPGAFGTAFFFHQVHYAEIKSWEHFVFVSFLPIYTGVSVLSMLFSGWALDKFGTVNLIPYLQLPLAAAFVCFAFGSDLKLLLLGFILFAITSGANFTLPNAFLAECYGTSHLGAIKGLASAVMVLGSALGPGITGLLIDSGVGLEVQYTWIAGYFVISSILVFVGVINARTELNNRLD